MCLDACPECFVMSDDGKCELDQSAGPSCAHQAAFNPNVMPEDRGDPASCGQLEAMKPSTGSAPAAMLSFSRHVSEGRAAQLRKHVNRRVEIQRARMTLQEMRKNQPTMSAITAAIAHDFNSTRLSELEDSGAGGFRRRRRRRRPTSPRRRRSKPSALKKGFEAAADFAQETRLLFWDLLQIIVGSSGGSSKLQGCSCFFCTPARLCVCVCILILS